MTMWRTGLLLATLVCAAGAAGTTSLSAAPADDYPNRPVKMIVPFPPGGSTDNAARIVAQRLTEVMGQSFVVDNRPGAGAAIGVDAAAKATPDGYTIVMLTVASVAVNPHLTKLPYDPFKDLAPISLASIGWVALAVNNDLPAKTVPDVIKLAKAKPGTLNFGSPGNGTIVHMYGEMFKIAADIDIVHVPYKGSGPAMTDLMSGQIQLYFESSVLPHVVAGKMRAVGTANTQRWPSLPDVPTFDEQGVKGMTDLQSWFGVMAPAATPKDIIDKLADQMAKILAEKDVAQKMDLVGMYPAPLVKEQFAEKIRADHARYGALIKRANIKLE
jgi:tripartite-type tricarboxylate transporter receptor subunit TctC